ncbi:MAG: hypothetical protein LC802_11495 [Acidobacteria bacterium]|nr:hypothetical protein [Acidobacteriota bacterium]
MNILVCLKQILDPEIPARDFRVHPNRREAERGSGNLVTNDEHNVPRIPKVRDVMTSYRMALTKWTLEDLGVNADEARAGNTYYEVVELFVPQKETRCEFVSGDTLDEKVEAFAKRIVEVTSAL